LERRRNYWNTKNTHTHTPISRTRNAVVTVALPTEWFGISFGIDAVHAEEHARASSGCPAAVTHLCVADPASTLAGFVLGGGCCRRQQGQRGQQRGSRRVGREVSHRVSHLDCSHGCFVSGCLAHLKTLAFNFFRMHGYQHTTPTRTFLSLGDLFWVTSSG